MKTRNTLIILFITAATTATALVWGQNATPLPMGSVNVQMGPTTPAPTDAQRADLKSKQLALLASETAVTPEMLQSLVELDILVNPPTEPQIMIISSMLDIRQMPAYQAAFKKYGSQLAQALPAKQPAARPDCALTLLKMPAILPPADAAKVTPYALAVLPTMSKEEVTGVLNNRWLMLKSPDALPVLLKMYDDLPDEKVSAGRYGSAQERDALLRRAYELNPEQVRPRILAAIKNPGARFYEYWITSLLALPDKELPEMDDAFAAMINAGGKGEVPTWVWTRLVSRYGTSKVLFDMKQYYEPAKGRWACALEQSMLAYFLRVDPDYGRTALAQAVGSRQTGCWRTLLQSLATSIYTPELEQQAIKSLDDRDAEVAMSAARALQTRGTPAAKDALVASLAKTYQAAPPTTTPALKDPDYSRRYAIINALLNGHTWVVSSDELAKIQELAIDPQNIEMCKAWAAQKSIPLHASTDGSGNPVLSLASESYPTLAELQRKLLLFPAATRFQLIGNEQDPTRQQLLAWAKEKKLAME